MITTTNKSSRQMNHICRQEDHDEKTFFKTLGDRQLSR
jgi:hypothetical protein